ncbi:ComF family protein [Vibrio gallicus]|uniref:ComF family protein n=1 Tax=Vibrio gallicus TaxID=190897 RepID=UPI0021C41A71|nr:ComF family protein [Vibrio gallicus]
MRIQSLHAYVRDNLIRLTGNYCSVCGCRIESATTSWCSACLKLIDEKPRCLRCGIEQERTVEICGQCVTYAVAWDQMYCVSNYQTPLSDYVKKVKYARQFWHVMLLARLLSERIKQPAPILLSVPTHWRRLCWRGFNQSDYLAYYLAPHIGARYLSNALIRTRHTKMQMALSRHNRLRNLKQAFIVNPKLIKYIQDAERVAIVDDVVTSGATVTEICRVLRRHGVKRIEVYCVCRAGLADLG